MSKLLIDNVLYVSPSKSCRSLKKNRLRPMPTYLSSVSTKFSSLDCPTVLFVFWLDAKVAGLLQQTLGRCRRSYILRGAGHLCPNLGKNRRNRCPQHNNGDTYISQNAFDVVHPTRHSSPPVGPEPKRQKWQGLVSEKWPCRPLAQNRQTD